MGFVEYIRCSSVVDKKAFRNCAAAIPAQRDEKGRPQPLNPTSKWVLTNGIYAVCPSCWERMQAEGEIVVDREGI